MRITHTLLVLALGLANVAWADTLSTSEVSIQLQNLIGAPAACFDQSQLASATSCFGGTAGPGVQFSGSAASSADAGGIRTSASMTIDYNALIWAQNPSVLDVAGSATATYSFTDVVTINSPGIEAGTPGSVSFGIVFSGNYNWDASGLPDYYRTDAFLFYSVGVSTLDNPDCEDLNPSCGAGLELFTGPAVEAGSTAGNIQINGEFQELPELFFLFGQPFTVRFTIASSVTGLGIQPWLVNQEPPFEIIRVNTSIPLASNFGNTTNFSGAVIRNADGQVISNVRIASEAGLDYVGAPVPEPSTALLILGAAAMLLLRRRSA